VTVALARHPVTKLPSGTCYGRLDADLATDSWPGLVGAIQATGVALVWNSPTRRCLCPARATGLPIVVDDRLREMDFGAWEGRHWDELPRAELDIWAADPHANAPPGGETGGTLIARVSAVWEQIVANGIGCAVVTHGGPLKVLSALVRGRAPDLMAPSPAFGSVDIIRC
jgi:alpha-ribazole phosphatase